ncbi:SSI family serine proteinase inhibitor [Streptomyces sp. NPDC047079]|uniref:SSI family serine proteinase inhibitor n=1 Tax=Streptomyces sp. NPDC047079 TaxID=3154607 RepID=UPI0033E6DB3D
MTTKTTLALRGALIAAAVLLPVVPAQAAPRPAATGNWLYLTVTNGDERSRDISGTLLLCDPPQGHSEAAEACAELDAVQGDIGRIPPDDSLCPMLYAPVTVSARGEWDGRPVEYSHTFANACELQARTGSVFALVDRGVPGVRDRAVPGVQGRAVPGLRHRAVAGAGH